MSSDMMIVCKEDSSSYEGKDVNAVKGEAALFVDECSMGEPWSEFGKWFQQRFYNGTTMLEAVLLRGHQQFIGHGTVAEADVVAVKEALKTMGTHEKLKKDELIEYMKSHVGKHISTENW